MFKVISLSIMGLKNCGVPNTLPPTSNSSKKGVPPPPPPGSFFKDLKYMSCNIKRAMSRRGLPSGAGISPHAKTRPLERALASVYSISYARKSPVESVSTIRFPSILNSLALGYCNHEPPENLIALVCLCSISLSSPRSFPW